MDKIEIRFARLLNSSSVELSPGDGEGFRLLPDYFSPKTIVHITFLPNERPARVIEMTSALARGGFVPVPHIAARSLTSREMLDDLVARAAGEGGVERVLLIGGDVDHPSGPFASSLDVLKTGLLQRYGIKSVSFAAHPEGHPAVDAALMLQSLREKVQFASAEGLSVGIINQLCFEAEPLTNWLSQLRAEGIEAPVRLGMAGPTSMQAMLRFALRCGVGNSVRALRNHGNTVGRLLADASPDELLHEVCALLPDPDLGGVEGLHFFVFGGLRKMGTWLRDRKTRFPSENAFVS